MTNKTKRHAGIFFLIAMGAFLLLADKFVSKTLSDTKFAGVLALVWACTLIRTSLGEEGKMKKIQETSFYEKIKEDPSSNKEE